MLLIVLDMGIIKTTLLEDEAKKYVKAFGELIKQVKNKYIIFWSS